MDEVIVLCHFCEIHGPTVVMTTRGYAQDELDLPIPVLNSVECDGCNFELNATNGFVSTDKLTGVKFVSSSQPISGYFTSNLVTQACVRSLSCEVYPQGGREGVIYFGDSERGHVMSMAFVLKDSQARGFQRTYSFLVIAREKDALMSGWEFYLRHLERIVSGLKEKATSVHDKELRQTSCQEKRSIRLNSVAGLGGRGRNPLLTQRSSSKARSLIELTNNNSVFANLHLEFSWILKNAHITQHVPKLDTRLYTGNDRLAGIEENMSVDTINCSVRWLYSTVGREKFRTAAYHALTGSQIIVRSKSRDLSKRVLMSLSQLLPKGCVKAVFDSTKYLESSKCNLLALVDSVPMPAVTDTEVLLIDMVDADEKQAVKCTIHFKGRLPEKLPRFLIELERILQDASFSDATLNTYLVSVKEEWLNKSKILYSFIKSRKEAPRGHEDAEKLYQAIGAQEADTKLMRFWMASGLTLHFKTNVYAVANDEPLLASRVNEASASFT